MMHSSLDRQAVILSAARTPSGRFMGALNSLRAPELGAAAVRAAVERAQIDPAAVYEVIMGNGRCRRRGAGPGPPGGAAWRTAQHGRRASVNKVCGSGLKAVMLAANGISRRGRRQLFVGGRHGEHVQRPLPAAQGAARAALRPRRSAGFAAGMTASGVPFRSGRWATPPNLLPTVRSDPRRDGRICLAQP